MNRDQIAELRKLKKNAEKYCGSPFDGVIHKRAYKARLIEYASALLDLAERGLDSEIVIAGMQGTIDGLRSKLATKEAILKETEANLGIEEGQGSIGIEIKHLRSQLAAVTAERDEARRRLLSAAGDDLCRLTQEEIKAMSAGAVKIPPKEEFLASCERFHAQVAGEAGVMHNCLTLAQLIAENEKLTTEVTRLKDLLRRADVYVVAHIVCGKGALKEQQEARDDDDDGEGEDLREIVDDINEAEAVRVEIHKAIAPAAEGGTP